MTSSLIPFFISKTVNAKFKLVNNFSLSPIANIIYVQL